VLAEKEELIEAEVEEVQELPSAWDISQSLLGNPTSTRSSRDFDEHDDDVTLPNSSIHELADLVLDSSSEWLSARVRSLAPASYLPPSSNPDILNNSLSLRSSGPGLGSTPSLLRDYRERLMERERARQRMHDPPRRRNSIHPSYADHSTSTSSSSSATTTPGERERSRLSRGSTLVPSLMPLETLGGLLAEQRRRQRRGGRLEAEMPFSYSYQDNGVDITGCTLAPDGRKL
jgi:hypothetical protein